MSAQLFRDCLRIMLQPLAKYCLRRSIGIQDFLEDLKVVFLRTAQDELRASGEELNVSRLSAMTGVHRRDVRRICKHDEEKSEPQNPMSKIIGRWQTDARFRRKDGRAKVLKISETENEFAELVQLVCSDLHHGTVYAELERLGLVEKVPTGLRLIQNGYVTRGNSKEAYQYMSQDIQDLMFAVEENINGQAETPNLHLSTIFDRVVSSAIPEIRNWFIREGTLLQQRAREFLSQFDYDTNSALPKKQEVSRVMLSSFSLTEPKKKQTKRMHAKK